MLTISLLSSFHASPPSSVLELICLTHLPVHFLRIFNIWWLRNFVVALGVLYPWPCLPILTGFRFLQRGNNAQCVWLWSGLDGVNSIYPMPLQLDSFSILFVSFRRDSYCLCTGIILFTIHSLRDMRLRVLSVVYLSASKVSGGKNR